MAERTVVIFAHEQGHACFTQGMCDRYLGVSFPVTDSKGVELAEATVVAAALLDAEGSRIALRFRVADEVVAAKGLEPDVGKMVQR